MNFDTIKAIKGGYLCNGSMSVPKSDGNRHYRMVLEDIANGSIVEPEFSTEELNDQLYSRLKRKRKRRLSRQFPMLMNRIIEKKS